MKKILLTSTAIACAFGSISAQTIVGGSYDPSSQTAFTGIGGASIPTISPGSNPATAKSNLFDGDMSIGNLGSFIFADSGAPGSTNYVEFELAAPVTIDSIIFSLADDQSINRSASGFSFYASAAPDPMTTGTIVSSGTIIPDYEDTYGNRQITITDSFTAIEAQYFRFEVTQASPFGVRVVEISSSPIPEPSTAALLLGVGALGFIAFRRTRRKRA